MNFKFSNLLGAPYRGGDLLIYENELLSPAGNRVTQIDLRQSVGSTLPFENTTQIRNLLVSPDGAFLVSIDREGKALFINRRRKVVLHHLSFKGPVNAARFSPDGRFIAVAVGRLLQVWRTPCFQKAVAPLQLHRTYGGCHADITALSWADDSFWIAVTAKDLTTRVFSLEPVEGFKPPSLTGHKEAAVGVFFTAPATQEAAQLQGKRPPVVYTVSRDGAVFGWTFAPSEGAGGGPERPAKRARGEGETRAEQEAEDGRAQRFRHGEWALSEKHFCNRTAARVTAADLHRPSGVLVLGYSTGVFDLLQMPDFAVVHSLSVSREKVSALAFNGTGDWIALGCAKLGQLLVWEWRSESYVVKQQGHYFDVAAARFSPDGAFIATGAGDCKVKVWAAGSGFCVVTFAEHTAAVTAVQWLPSGQALLSASLDGTVRAYDLVRYRNFRTMSTPQPVQLASLATDPAGEIVCAGASDTFEVFVWSVKTGRLLDTLAAHKGPVAGLAFCPTQPVLASASWDGTVRTWDVFAGKGGIEQLQHNHDVLALAWRPSGEQLASATLNGDIYLWNPHEAALQGVIAGRRDIKGGRLAGDRRAAGNLASGACFTSLEFSADGAFLLAGGNSKWVCLYDVEERVLLRRFQISRNRALDGVLDQLNSKQLTDAGPLDLLQASTGPDDGGDDGDPQNRTEDAAGGCAAGTAAGASGLPGTGHKKRPMVRAQAVALSPTGRSWAAATTEGLLLYSLDDDLLFDPTDLAEDITVAAAHKALGLGQHLKALVIALRLNTPDLVQHVLLSTPTDRIGTVVSGTSAAHFPALLDALATCFSESAHLEHLLRWSRALALQHGPALQTASRRMLPQLRALLKAVTKAHDDLAKACDSNLYTLRFLTSAAS